MARTSHIAKARKNLSSECDNIIVASVVAVPEVFCESSSCAAFVFGSLPCAERSQASLRQAGSASVELVMKLVSKSIWSSMNESD